MDKIVEYMINREWADDVKSDRKVSLFKFLRYREVYS